MVELGPADLAIGVSDSLLGPLSTHRDGLNLAASLGPGRRLRRVPPERLTVTQEVVYRAMGRGSRAPGFEAQLCDKCRSARRRICIKQPSGDDLDVCRAWAPHLNDPLALERLCFICHEVLPVGELDSVR